jgi:regulator of cell morphogenesis and NO signaling
MNPECVLELSDVATTEHRERIVSAFNRLVVGQTFELLLGVPAQASGLLEDFQKRHGQSFDWWPFGVNANGLRLLIAKHAPEPRSISGFLGIDHSRLTGYWNEFLAAVKACAMSHEALFTTEKDHRIAVVDRLSQFILGLRRHIRMEETFLFPLFEERSRIPIGSGPTAVMRAEHQELEATLRTLEKLQEAGSCATVIQTIEGQAVHPSVLFRSHDSKEESVLYPMADRIFTQPEKDELCLKMQTV